MTDFDNFGSLPPTDMAWGVNFGGGVNSTALLLALHDRGLKPNFVLFSDTGSERPETYDNVKTVAEWCESVGFPFAECRWIRRDGSFESIHDNCLRTNYLPSKAYGYSGCTYKWKIQPMQKWRKVNGFSPATIAIGFDAGESRRLKRAQKALCEKPEQDSDETIWYPLVGFAMNREACEERIRLQGWNIVKSACFLCPNMRPAEWDALKVEHPDLYSLADKINDNAKAAGNAETKSLFRSYDPKNATCVCNADGCLTSSEVEE